MPTVPANVFRVTVENYSLNGELDIFNQELNMHGIGRLYFDDATKNDSGYYSGSNDLYHMGDQFINDTLTVESFLKTLNTNYALGLPVFNNGYYDTTRSSIPIGLFSEAFKMEERGVNFRIDYGISNDIMLTAVIPNVISQKQTYNTSSTIDKIYGIDGLVNYHTNAKAILDSFFTTNSFLTLPKGKRDTLEIIYDDIYSPGGNHSVLWALYAKDNPFSKGFIDSRFMPPTYSTGDTVTIDSLELYYGNLNKAGSGVNDISLGITALIKGSPTWIDKKGGVLYGRVLLSFPFGFTIESFNKVGSAQLSQLNIGSGVTRISLGLLGGYNWRNNKRSRIYGGIDIRLSTPELLNTPVSFYSGAHTNPDSIISHVGEKYKFKEGNWINSMIGYEVGVLRNRVLFKIESKTFSKARDTYTSLDSDWDNWMAERSGFDSAFSKWDLCFETWILNSKAAEKFGPIAFDVVFGIKKTINNKYAFNEFKFYSGITTYLQGW